jgi:hypothetical protein
MLHLSAGAALSVLLGLAASVSAESALDAQTHHRLLLSGRPQVGLWKALNEQAKEAAGVESLL